MYKVTNLTRTYLAIANTNLKAGASMEVPHMTESLRYLESKGGISVEKLAPKIEVPEVQAEQVPPTVNKGAWTPESRAYKTSFFKKEKK